MHGGPLIDKAIPNELLCEYDLMEINFSLSYILFIDIYSLLS